MVPLARQLILESLVHPRTAAGRILRLGAPPPVSVCIGFLAIILATLLGVASQFVLPIPQEALVRSLMAAPMLTAGLQALVFLAMSMLVLWIGRAFGGNGTWPGALALMAWVQAMLLVLQLAQLVTYLALPALGTIVSLGSVVWFFWATAAFTATLHGFRDVLKVLGGVFISFLAMLIAAVLLVELLRIPLPGTG
ncbi:Yip1 family protein [Halovulum sp. GXIMD14794]